MKKIIFTLISCSALYFASTAQYCGVSGTSVCTPSASLTKPGLYPVSDSLAPILNGVDTAVVIQFVNYDTVTAAGQLITVQSLLVDSINNLPAGLCWATDTTSNAWGNQQRGCIKVSGEPCATPGQYQLDIWVTVNGQLGPLPASYAGLFYFVRVVNPGDSTTTIDSTRTNTAQDSVWHYGTEQANCILGIKEIGSNIGSLKVYPNPFSTQTMVTFNADKSGELTEKITDMLGNVISTRNVQITIGPNTRTVERGNLAPGVYFYTLSDGTAVYTKRLVISE